MIWLKIPFGALILLLSTAVPPALLGFAFFERPGAFLGALLGLAVALGLLASGDRGVRNRLRAKRADSPGFERTAQLAMARYGLDEEFDIPCWYVYPGAAPGMIAMRSPFSRGTVFVSEGLIALLEETELRAALAYGVRQVRAPGVVLRTLCLKILLILANTAPQRWKKLVFGAASGANSSGILRERDYSPLSLAAFAVLMPLIGFYSKVGRGLTQRRSHDDGDPAKIIAMRKIERALKLHGPAANDVAVFAGLVNLALER